MKKIFCPLEDDLYIDVSLSSTLVLNGQGVSEDHAEKPIQIAISGTFGDPDERVVFADGLIFDRDIAFEAADADSQDMENIAEVICARDGRIDRRYANQCGNLACFMSCLLVPEKYRNCGIASLLQKNLREVIQKSVPDLCGIYAYAAPWELKDNDVAFQARQAELIKFYKKFGFKQVKGTPVIWMPVPD